MTLTLTNPKTGQTLTSSLTEQQVRDYLRTRSDEFATSLAGRRVWSAGQAFWAHKLAVEGTTPRQPVVNVGNAAGVIALFAKASSRLKFPAITIADATGRSYRISPAKSDSPNAGSVYVKVGGEYAGKLSPAGVWSPSRTCPAGVAEFLVQFAANPAQHAAAHGHATGNCCFCSRLLTDAVSVAVGYGPVCAENYGLPHRAPQALEEGAAISATEASAAVVEAPAALSETAPAAPVFVMESNESALLANAAKLLADDVSCRVREGWVGEDNEGSAHAVVAEFLHLGQWAAVAGPTSAHGAYEDMPALAW